MFKNTQTAQMKWKRTHYPPTQTYLCSRSLIWLGLGRRTIFWFCLCQCASRCRLSRMVNQWYCIKLNIVTDYDKVTYHSVLLVVFYFHCLNHRKLKHRKLTQDEWRYILHTPGLRPTFFISRQLLYILGLGVQKVPGHRKIFWLDGDINIIPPSNLLKYSLCILWGMKIVILIFIMKKR